MTTPATRFSDEKFSSADISKSLENKTTGATTYKLEYFEVSGVGAISRDLLSYGGAKWENILVKELPNNTGSPFSVYPALHVRTGDGVEIHLAETSVIEQYLAREFGLFGDNEWEELQIKMFHSNTLMFRDRLFMRVVWNFKDKMETALETFLTQSLPQWINAHVFHLRNNGSNGHYVGNKLSLADILTANTIDFIKCLYGNEKILAMIEKCPEIMKVKENVDREPRLQTWRQSEEYKSIAENTRLPGKQLTAFLGTRDAPSSVKSSGNLVSKNLNASAVLHRSSPSDTVNPAELFGSAKKAVLIGVPGAFTPGCSKSHVPGYLKHYDELKSKGIDLIGCVSVNDAFVMDAWGKDLKVENKITMLADPQGSFVKDLGLDFDASAALGGVRSKRFALVLENGKITKAFVEPNNTGLSVSLAENVLKEL